MYKLQGQKKQFILFLTILTTFLWTFLTLQAQQFTPTSLNGSNITYNDIETLLEEQEKLYLQKGSKQADDERIQSLIVLSQLNRSMRNYSAAYNYAGEALFLAEELNNPQLLFLAHQEYGLLNYLFKQDKAAEANLKASLQFAKTAYKEGDISHQELYPAYYSWLLFNQRIENYEQMSLYIDSCQSFIDQYNWGDDKKIYIKEKTAFLKFNTNKKDEAIELLEEAATLIETQNSLSMHRSFLIIIYGVLANDLRISGQADEAIPYFEKAFTIQDTYGEHTFYLEYLHTEFAKILNSKGNTKAAYQHMLRGKQINDNFLNPRKDASQGFLSIKDRYLEELNQRNISLQTQALEIAEQKANLWRFRVFFFIALLLLTVSILLILRKRQHHKQEIEITAFMERRRHNEALIEHKNKELTSNMLQLIEKEEIIKKLSDTLQEELPASKTKPLLKSIEQQSTSLWEDFNKRFMEQNADFYEKLKDKSPNLSAADLKICALIKLNFSGKEMAYLLGISEGSVHVARHRLRKKFDIGRETNLVQFINGI